MKKIIFFGSSLDHLPYYASLVYALRKNRIIIYTYKKPTKRSLSLYKYLIKSGVIFKQIQPKYLFVHKLKIFLSSLSYKKASKFFYAKRLINFISADYTPVRFLLYCIWFFLRFLPNKYLHNLFSFLHNLSINPKYETILKHEKPHYVFITPGNIRQSYEADALIYAKKLGINTSLLVLSWDATSTKCFYNNQYDNVFCWNNYHFDDLVNIHQIPKNHIHIVGSLYHEWNFKNKINENKKCFYNSKKISILWLGSSKNIVQDESKYIRSFLKDVSSGNQLIDLTIQCHPSNHLKNLENQGFNVQYGELNFSSSSNFSNNYMKYNFAVGINTTAMLDASISGLPVFYYPVHDSSVNQTNTEHFERFIKYANFLKFSSLNDCISQINNLKRKSFSSFYIKTSKKIINKLKFN